MPDPPWSPWAGHPFDYWVGTNDPDEPVRPCDDLGDIILRASDNLDFVVHQSILSRASPFFKNMFSSNLTDSSLDLQRLDLPVIVMAENQHTLDMFLRLLYPMAQQTVDGITDVTTILQVLDKYEIDSLPAALEASLMRIAEEKPDFVCTVACHFKSPKLANATAQLLLQYPVVSISSLSTGLVENYEVSSAVRKSLFKYRAHCTLTAIELLEHYKPYCASYKQGFLGSYYVAACNCVPEGHSRYRNDSRYSVIWVLDYLDRCRIALEQTPYWKVVLDPSIIIPSVIKAMKCKVCKHNAETMGQLSQELAEKIRSSVARVR